MNKYLALFLLLIFPQAFSAPGFLKKLIPSSNRVKPFVSEENWKSLLKDLIDRKEVTASSDQRSLKSFNDEIFFKTLRDEASLLTDNPSKIKKLSCLAEVKKLELKNYGFSQTSRDIKIAQTMAAMIIFYCKNLFCPDYHNSLVLKKTLTLLCVELAKNRDTRLLIDQLVRYLACNQECFCSDSFEQDQEIYICPQCNAMQHYNCLKLAKEKSMNKKQTEITCAICMLEGKAKKEEPFVFVY